MEENDSYVQLLVLEKKHASIMTATIRHTQKTPCASINVSAYF